MDIINLSNTSLLQYIGLWKTGINTFLNYPFTGVGPTNIQNYLELDLITNFDPYKNNEHPHNHYIQSFGETGVIGGLSYTMMVIVIIRGLYVKIINDLKSINYILKCAAFVSSICLFWPFSNTHDLFGQQQNCFLWYSLSLYMVINSSLGNEK
tara:strand:+ start:46 stop:504 length:459 start_codon:yes stop_codon:yes gene_type:complete